MDNKEFIKKLVKISDDILTMGQKINSKKKKSKDLKPLYDNLAKLLEKRFNIKYEIQSGALLATYVPYNFVDSSINKFNIKEFVKNVEDKNLEKFIEHNNKVFEIDNGFYIDYKNKKIIYKGINKFKAIVLMDPITMYTIGVSPEELAAMLLHEIGHDFEYLRYTIYMASKTQNIIEQMIKASTGDNPLDKLVEIAVKETNKNVEIEELTTVDKIKIIFNLPTELFKAETDALMEREKLSSNILTLKESEIMADKFVSNFGLEHYLASGLNKLRLYADLAGKTYRYTLGKLYINIVAKNFSGFLDSLAGRIIASIVSIMIWIYIFIPIYKKIYSNLDNKQKKILGDIIETIDRIWGLYLTAIYIRNIPAIISYPSIIIKTIGFSSASLAFDYFKNYRESSQLGMNPYEDSYMRIDSIKRNLIEKLKYVDDIEIKKYLISQINEIEKEIKESRRRLSLFKNFSMLPTIIPVILRTNDLDALSPVYVLSRLIKEHINNDLYVDAARLDIMNNGS